MTDLPSLLIDRLRHYFLTYKLVPGHEGTVRLEATYGRERALEVIRASMADYDETFGG